MKEIELIKRKAVNIYSEEELDKLLKSGKKLKIKFGADPSRPDLHIGHSVPLKVLRLFQDMGHEVNFIIGDFTGMIGDPSGKSKARKALTFEETRKSAETYLEQFTKILDKEKTRILFNSEWLSKMNLNDLIALTSKYTVAQIMERDDFKGRFENGIPIYMHEMLYPLMQGYDSVAINADIEIGGTDQTFNLLVGRELQREYNQDSQVVITFPLLVGLDGKEKMSKSLDNYIGLSDEPLEKIKKSIKIPDEVLKQYFELATNLDSKEIEKILSGDIYEAHFRFAEELIKMYDEGTNFNSLKEEYIKIAKGSIPENIKIFEINKEEIDIVDLVCELSFASSKSEAKRLILGNAIKVNSVQENNILSIIKIENDMVISCGKNKFVKIKKT